MSFKTAKGQNHDLISNLLQNIPVVGEDTEW